MSRILIIYHSQSGRTSSMAEWMAKGEIDEGILEKCGDPGMTVAAGCKEGIY